MKVSIELFEMIWAFQRVFQLSIFVQVKALADQLSDATQWSEALKAHNKSRYQYAI